MSNNLIDFLQNDFGIFNETDFKELKNNSCSTGNHIIFTAFDNQEMNFVYTKPAHKDPQNLSELPPIYAYNGRVGGSYCNKCGEMITFPSSIDNSGYYLLNDSMENLDYPYDDSTFTHFYTWVSLLSSNIININEENEVILKEKPSQSNSVWVIPNAIKGIAAGAFQNFTTLQAISLPASMQTLRERCFDGCSNLNRIDFRGTMEQWRNIIKHNTWNLNTGDYKVYCIDGILQKEENVDYDTFFTAIHSYSNAKHIFNLQVIRKNYFSNDMTLKFNCKFIENYHYGDTIEFIFDGQILDDLNIITNTGDYLLNNCFVKNTIGNFYINIEEKLATFIPSYYLLDDSKHPEEKEDSENDES